MKFHDYDMLLDYRIKSYSETAKYPVVYRLTGLIGGSACLIYSASGDPGASWTRKTKNEGSNGSIRYSVYSDLDTALAAGITWARRKDAEKAAEAAVGA